MKIHFLDHRLSTLPVGTRLSLPGLTMIITLPAGTTYLPVGTTTLPVETTYLPVTTTTNNLTSRNYIPAIRNYYSTNKFVNKPVVENRKSDEEVSEIVMKNIDAPIIKEWVSDNQDSDGLGNMSYLTDYEEIDGGYVAFGGNPKGGKITGRIWLGHLNFKTMNKLVKRILVRGLPSKLFENDETCVACQKGKQHRASCILRQFSIARTLQQNRVAERRNRTLIEAARTMLADSKLPTTFWAEIVNTAYHLGKFDGKDDEGFFVGYSLNSKAFRVFNSRTRIVEENLHIRFSESTSNVVGSGPDWLFDIDALIRIMNYEPIVAGTQSNGFAGTKASDNKVDEDPRKNSECNDQEKEDNVNSTNNVNAASTNKVNVVGGKTSIKLPFDPDMTALEDYSIFDFTRYDEMMIIHKDHPLDQVIGDLQSATQTRQMSKNLEEHGFVCTIQQRTNHKDLQNCLFACFLSQEEPKKVIHALKDLSWIEAMQEELLQFKLQEVWTLVDLPNGKRAIGSKWIFRNKKDERGIVIRNKERLVTQGYTQEEGINYDEVFALVARIEAIRLFLAYASFKDFVVYQMDVKSVFLYGKIEEEVYVCQPPGFKDPDFPDRVYKVEKALYGLHQAPRAWYETLSTYLLDNGFQRGKIDKTLFIKRYKGDILLVQVYVDDIIFGSTKKELCIAFEKLMHEKFQMSSMGELTFFLGLQVKQKKDGIFISQDKYVEEILKKFGFTEVKTASTPMETQKPLLKDEDGKEVDVHMYRSMIGSLMYLTSSRPDIMFAVCACARYQVNPKVSHLHVVKRIFRYLKGQPKLGLWYLKDSPFDLVAYTDSDYAGASLDRKSTIGEAEYVAASSCCGQVLWIQNQLLDYGYNFMHTKVFIDNNRKAKKSVRLVMEKLFRIELELILAKTINGEVQLHALVDDKKVIITEVTVRRYL
ncbi:putative ribonuclease H-like domain-containing protein [Tanacetum coccineum]|uniref:Ribonuclease H-like domain-containing protein n=1 Tax=Tanacetum coccineum TaxID=301880 RepID=A0ABQ5FVS4_9ASTR